MTSFGQICTDSVNVYFRVGQYDFDPALGSNRTTIDSFIDAVRKSAAASDLKRIDVYGYASPEGASFTNEALARERCATIARYLAEHAGVSRDFIAEHPVGIDWDALRRLVYSTPDMSNRQKVLDILDNTPVWVYDADGKVIDGRKKQLMDLAGGRTWSWMTANLFPQLRNVTAISLCRRTPTGEGSDGVQTEDTVAPGKADQTADGELNILSPDDNALEEATADSLNNNGTRLKDGGASLVASEIYEPFHRLALKTNMLYYAILMPNLELEWLINKNWSVAVEGNIAWWGRYSKMRSYRMAVIDVEGRRWIKPRKPWHGMYVGVIAGGGWYDLQKGRPGKYGDGLMAGVSFGYMWPIGRNLSLEAEIGAGYIYSRYKEYEYHDGHHVYMRTKALNYFGPIKLKFSIAWRFLDANKPRSTQSVK